MGQTVRSFRISDLLSRGEDGPQRARAQREAPLQWRVIGPAWGTHLAALREDGRPIDVIGLARYLLAEQAPEGR